MNFTLLVVVLLTAIAFVGIVIALSNAIAPRSYNAQKMEPYECGIPTRGKSWMQFRVGYYLFAILFLMFEVETVFLFPWAVITRELGVAGLFSVLFFLIILILGLALCLEERSFGMEVTKKPKIKSIPYEEFTDNETLEKLVRELNAGGAMSPLAYWTTSSTGDAATHCGLLRLQPAVAVSNSWPSAQPLRYGALRVRGSPCQSAPGRHDYGLRNNNQQDGSRSETSLRPDGDPKYVVAVGGCAVSGGPFKKSYHVVNGVDKILPVDVYIPGCPPRPEAFYYGMMQLQRKVKIEKYFGGVNRKEENH